MTFQSHKHTHAPTNTFTNTNTNKKEQEIYKDSRKETAELLKYSRPP